MKQITKFKGVSKKGKSRIKEHGEWWIATGKVLANRKQYESYTNGYTRWVAIVDDKDFLVVKSIAWNETECSTLETIDPLSEIRFENRLLKLKKRQTGATGFVEDGLTKDIIQCTSCVHSKEGCSKGHWLGSPMEVEGNENWDNCKDFKEK